MKQITPEQHLEASTTHFKTVGKAGEHKGEVFSYPRFTKPLETQAAATKRYEAARKRALKARERRIYPSGAVAAKSTKDYVYRFYVSNNLGTPPYRDLSETPTVFAEFPEVEFTEIDPLTEFEELVESLKDLI